MNIWLFNIISLKVHKIDIGHFMKARILLERLLSENMLVALDPVGVLIHGGEIRETIIREHASVPSAL